jgi:hypothetical protein
MFRSEHAVSINGQMVSGVVAMVPHLGRVSQPLPAPILAEDVHLE